MNAFTSSWQPNELIFYGHFFAAIELNLCIKWRLKLPFCLFCRLCSTSLPLTISIISSPQFCPPLS